MSQLINNTLVNLGVCSNCKRPMTPQDFLATTLVKGMNMAGYNCASCIGAYMLNRKPVASASASATTGKVDLSGSGPTETSALGVNDIICDTCGLIGDLRHDKFHIVTFKVNDMGNWDAVCCAKCFELYKENNK